MHVVNIYYDFRYSLSFIYLYIYFFVNSVYTSTNDLA